MRGVDAVLASVLILLISITAIFLALQLGGSATQRTQEILLMQEGQSNLINIDNAVKSVLAEGEGSVRVLRFSILGGEYKIDNSSDSIQFSMDTRSQIIAEGVSKTEDGINFTGSAGMVYLNLSYDNIQITGEGDFGRGYHTLTIRNNGFNETTQKQMIYISLTPPVPTTVTTFTDQYNQVQTFVFKGVNITSPSNLNDLGVNYYNIVEGLESGGQHNYFQESTANITGFNTTSADYTNILDNQNYNVTSTSGQSGGNFINQYNQSQTVNIIGINTTSPNYLNVMDGQSYNVTESVRAVNWSNQTSDQESGIIQYKGTFTANTYGTGWLSPSSNTVLKGTGWNNPTNAYASGGGFANAGGVNANATNYSGFSPNIPAGATILGIQVNITGNCSSNTGTNDIGAEVRNTTVWSNTGHATADLQTGGPYATTLGATNDLWGLTWTPTTVNSIGVNVTGSSSATSRIMYLDQVAVNITYQNTTGDTEANKSYTTYSNVYPSNVLSAITSISITVNVSAYNNTASRGKNSNPDLWVEMNASNTWVEIGNMSVIGTGNISVTTTNSQILGAWQDVSSRDIRIKARYIDANATAWDEINYTAVWVTINSIDNYYRAEIEHNATGVSWSGTLNNINVSVNFTTNVTSNFNLTIYNFNSGSWNYIACQSGTAVANAWYSFWCNVTNNPSYYNSSDGKIRVRLNGTEHPSVALIREDYIQYYVNYTIPTTYANVSVEHNSSAISEDPLTITKINVTTVLKTNISSGIPFRFYIYNFSSNSWEQCAQASVNISYAKMECIILVSPSNYISNSKIRIRLNSSGNTTTHQMMEDYLTYQITMPNEYRMEVEHNATGVSWSGTLDNVSISLNFSTNSTNSPTFNFLVYNFISGNWEICDTFSPPVNVWNMRWCNETTSPSNYLSGGKIRIRLNETSHPNFAEVREDYVQYYVTYTQ